MFVFSVRGIVSQAKAKLRHIGVCHAITLFEVFQLKNSYGKFSCKRCQTEISKRTEATREQLHNDAFECLFDPESVCCVEDSIEDKDLDYQQPFDPSINEEKIKEQITALNNFLVACGSKKKVSVTTSYKDLSHRVKIKICKFSEIHNAISYIVDGIE